MMIECGSMEIEGEDHVRTYLFWRLQAGGMIAVSSGLFDDTDDLNFDHQIFIDTKPTWYTFANETKDMTGAEVFAMFQGPEGIS